MRKRRIKPRNFQGAADSGGCLGEELLDHVRRLDAGQPLVEPLVAEREALVVEAQQVQHRGVEVADVDRVLDDVVGEIVGLAVDRARPRRRRRPSTW